MTPSQKLDLILANNTIGFWVWDIQSNQLDWDDAMYQLHGIQANNAANTITIEQWLSLYKQNDAQQLGQLINNPSTEQNVELKLATVTQQKALRLIAKVEYNQQNQAQKIIGCVQPDLVSEIQNQLNIYQDVMAHIPNQVFWKDRDLNYLGCNKHFAQVLGLEDHTQIQGKSDFDFQISREHAELYRNEDQRIIATSKAELDKEEPYHHSDGSEGYAITSKVPLINQQGETYGMLGICTDITDRIKVEKRLAGQAFKLTRMNQQYSQVVEGVGIGLWTWDILTDDNYWSPTFYKLLGFTDNEINANFSAWEQRLHPNDKQKMFDALDVHLKQQGKYDLELRLRCKNGQYRWFSVKGSAEFDYEGTPLQMVGNLEDIHQQKSLAIENKRLLDVFDATFDMVVQTCADNKLTYLNNAFRQRSGLFQSLANIPPNAQHTEEQIDTIATQVLPEALKNGIWKGELGIKDQQGNQFPCSCITIAHINEIGEPEHFTFIFRDISEVKAKEASLQAQKQIFEELISFVPVMLNSFDEQGNCQLWNKTCEQLLGYSFEQAAAEPDLMARFYPDPTLRQQVLDNITNPDGKFREYPVVIKNGEIRTQLWSNILLSNGMMIGCGIDITEITEAKHQLQQSQANYELVIQGAGVGIWDWVDIETEELFWSDKFYQHIGHEPQAFETSVATFSDLLHPEDKEPTWQAVSDHLNKGLPYDKEYRIKCKDGQYRWVRATGKAKLDAKTGKTRMAGSMELIHHRKMLEERLITLKEAAESANLAKSEFLANMSHEIRTPMNGILGALQLLENEVGQGSHRQLIDNALFSAQSLLAIINDILDFSKIEANMLQLEAVNFSIEQIVESIISDLMPQANSKSIHLRKIVDGNFNNDWIGDPTRIRQVMLNLVSNAVKFTEQGYVNIELFCQTSNDQPSFCFKISDTGIGMDAQAVKQLFERFTQADSSTTRQFGGTGLGMAITKNLIDLMDGTITVESQLAKGTTFTVCLPLKPAKTTTVETPTDANQAPDLTGKRVLIAEDNEINQVITKYMLDKTNAEVEIAINGQIAIDLYHTFKPDLILMDIQMPQKDGLQACKEIRAINQDIPIFALTANVIVEDVETYLSNGFNAHLGKPIEMEKLYQLLNDYFK